MTIFDRQTDRPRKGDIEALSPELKNEKLEGTKNTNLWYPNLTSNKVRVFMVKPNSLFSISQVTVDPINIVESTRSNAANSTAPLSFWSPNDLK